MYHISSILLRNSICGLSIFPNTCFLQSYECNICEMKITSYWRLKLVVERKWIGITCPWNIGIFTGFPGHNAYWTLHPVNNNFCCFGVSMKVELTTHRNISLTMRITTHQHCFTRDEKFGSALIHEARFVNGPSPMIVISSDKIRESKLCRKKL